MAERYTLFTIEKLRDRFQLPQGVPAGVKRNYNISPSALGAVVVSRDGVPVLERMKWGFIPATAKNDNSVFRYKTYLAKSEGIFSKATWQDSIRQRRCLVPANGYYEWRQTPDGKVPFYVRPADQELCALAGVYSTWTDPEGVQWGTYAIVTALHDRGPKQPLQRPIILDKTRESEWINPDITDMSDIYGLMHITPDDELVSHQVTFDVKNTKANGERLISPVA